jgi:hypothetical protein
MKMEQRTKEQQEADRILVFVPHQTPAHSWVAYSDSDVINLAMETEHHYINEHFAPELGEDEVGRGYVPSYDQAIEALGHDLQVLTVLHNAAEVLDYLERSGPGRAVGEVQGNAELLGWIKSPRQAALDRLIDADAALRGSGSADPLADKIREWLNASSVEIERDSGGEAISILYRRFTNSETDWEDLMVADDLHRVGEFCDWLEKQGGRS